MKKILLLLSILVLALVALSGCWLKPTNTTLKSNANLNAVNAQRLQTCPDQWIDNRQPCNCDDQPCNCGSQYLIINGQRQEITGYDLDWIKGHCPVNKPTAVY